MIRSISRGGFPSLEICAPSPAPFAHPPRRRPLQRPPSLPSSSSLDSNLLQAALHGSIVCKPTWVSSVCGQDCARAAPDASQRWLLSAHTPALPHHPGVYSKDFARPCIRRQRHLPDRGHLFAGIEQFSRKAKPPTRARPPSEQNSVVKSDAMAPHQNPYCKFPK